MTDPVVFTAYPDISSADMLYMRFAEATYDRKDGFVDSLTIATDVDFSELFHVLKEKAHFVWGGRSSAGYTIYGEDEEKGVLFLLQKTNNTVWVSVSGSSPTITSEWISEFSLGCPPIQEADDNDHIQINFWMMGSTPQSIPRSLEIFHWGECQRNYPTAVREQLSNLMVAAPPEVGGKLVLWHGEPGGGKTSAIKALADAWRGWADTEYITDPEIFFGSAAYMITVLNRAPSSPEKWRLIVVEDAGQFVVKGADVSSGQAFSRLLNLTDGLLGQGMKTILLVTTNQGLRELHPALSRPGRCMANIQFDEFSTPEASEWLGRTVDGPKTLAALYEEQLSTVIQTKNKTPSHGAYL